VEFAVAGTALFIVLLGVIETSRMMYAHTVLEEGVRRGARLAAVCPLNDPAIAAAAAFAGGGPPLLPGFTTSNIQVTYLNSSGAVVGDLVGGYTQIRYVRVAVQNYTQPLLVPFLSTVFAPVGVSATLPRESLGVSPTAVNAC
jgi:Flp pilus assembly protein TadG